MGLIMIGWMIVVVDIMDIRVVKVLIWLVCMMIRGVLRYFKIMLMK